MATANEDDADFERSNNQSYEADQFDSNQSNSSFTTPDYNKNEKQNKNETETKSNKDRTNFLKKISIFNEMEKNKQNSSPNTTTITTPPLSTNSQEKPNQNRLTKRKKISTSKTTNESLSEDEIEIRQKTSKKTKKIESDEFDTNNEKPKKSQKKQQTQQVKQNKIDSSKHNKKEKTNKKHNSRKNNKKTDSDDTSSLESDENNETMSSDEANSTASDDGDENLSEDDIDEGNENNDNKESLSSNTSTTSSASTPASSLSSSLSSSDDDNELMKSKNKNKHLKSKSKQMNTQSRHDLEDGEIIDTTNEQKQEINDKNVQVLTKLRFKCKEVEHELKKLKNFFKINKLNLNEDKNLYKKYTKRKIKLEEKLISYKTRLNSLITRHDSLKKQIKLNKKRLKKKSIENLIGHQGGIQSSSSNSNIKKSSHKHHHAHHHHHRNSHHHAHHKKRLNKKQPSEDESEDENDEDEENKDENNAEDNLVNKNADLNEDEDEESKRNANATFQQSIKVPYPVLNDKRDLNLITNILKEKQRNLTKALEQTLNTLDAHANEMDMVKKDRLKNLETNVRQQLTRLNRQLDYVKLNLDLNKLRKDLNNSALLTNNVNLEKELRKRCDELSKQINTIYCFMKEENKRFLRQLEMQKKQNDDENSDLIHQHPHKSDESLKQQQQMHNFYPANQMEAYVGPSGACYMDEKDHQNQFMMSHQRSSNSNSPASSSLSYNMGNKQQQDFSTSIGMFPTPSTSTTSMSSSSMPMNYYRNVPPPTSAVGVSNIRNNALVQQQLPTQSKSAPNLVQRPYLQTQSKATPPHNPNTGAIRMPTSFNTQANVTQQHGMPVAPATLQQPAPPLPLSSSSTLPQIPAPLTPHYSSPPVQNPISQQQQQMKQFATQINSPRQQQFTKPSGALIGSGSQPQPPLGGVPVTAPMAQRLPHPVAPSASASLPQMNAPLSHPDPSLPIFPHLPPHVNANLQAIATQMMKTFTPEQIQTMIAQYSSNFNNMNLNQFFNNMSSICKSDINAQNANNNQSNFGGGTPPGRRFNNNFNPNTPNSMNPGGNKNPTSSEHGLPMPLPSELSKNDFDSQSFFKSMSSYINSYSFSSHPNQSNMNKINRFNNSNSNNNNPNSNSSMNTVSKNKKN